MANQNSEPSTTTGGEKALVGVVAAAAGLVLTILGGGGLACLVTGGGWTFPGYEQWVTTVAGILTHAGDPAAGYPDKLAGQVPGAGAFWGVTGGLLLVVVFVATFIAIALAVRRTPVGMTTRAKAKEAMTGTDRTKPFCSYAVVPLSMRTGDAGLVVAPQQSGKTTGIAAPAIVDAPGPVVATSTKADLVDLTLYARQELRPDSRVYVFDADRITGLANCKWDPVAGCEDTHVAQERAAAMVAARPLGTGGSSKFFNDSCTLVLRSLLHAAAVGALDLMAVRAWVQRPTEEAPYVLLEQSPYATGWAEDLRSIAQTADPRSAGNVNLTLNVILSALAMPAVAEQVTPGPGEGLDIAQFLRRPADTLYVMSSGTDGGTSPIATALVASIVHEAKQTSQTTPTRKLDPILRVVLDEVANGCPLPKLDELLSDGGGRGIQTLAFVQAFAQLEDRWGDKAGIIWGAPSIRILLGGCGETKWLREISDLLGTKKVFRKQVSHGRGGGSVSTGTEREPVLPVNEISTLSPGKALLLYRSTVRAVVTIDGYWKRKDADVFERSLQQSRAATGRPAPAVKTVRATLRRINGCGAPACASPATADTDAGAVPSTTDAATSDHARQLTPRTRA